MPKIIDHQAYRLTLLERARVLFAEKGYAETSMRQIAEALEVSTGTLYHYFPNKEELFKQLFLSISQRDVSEFLAMAQETSSLEERIDLIFAFVESNETEIYQFMPLTFDYLRIHQQNSPEEFIQRSIEEYRNAIITLTQLPADLGLVVYSTLEGLILQRFLTPGKVNLTASLALLKKMILNTIETTN
jgi:AcrR family transcriptional regulator